ncbi:MAG: Type 1 glutamine amidotransferase-like domain-containing protein [Planctomycetota bacterium]
MSKKKIEYVWDPRKGELSPVEIESEFIFPLKEELNFAREESKIATISSQLSIQWGSGKPGENGSATIERNLFEKLAFRNPQIVFVPFHGIVGPENDWTRFLQIYQPLTQKKIKLVELNPGRPPKDVKKFYDLFEDADLIVLGSGIVEPYMELLHLLHFGKRLLSWQKQGKILYGYSAGTIALGEIYIHYFLGQEILMHLFLAEQNSAQMAKALRSELREYVDEETMTEMDTLVQEMKTKGMDIPIRSSFRKKNLGMMKAPTFQLVPKVVVLPHYGEYFLCTEDHLRTMTKRHPQWINIGIPNGMALIHRIENGILTTEVFGHNPRVPVTMIGKNSEVLHFRDGEKIPIER